MNCDRCKEAIAKGQEESWGGQTLCEDCYMDVFSPARTCDPWAVRSASLFSDTDGGGSPQVSPVQEKILAIIAQTGGASLETLCTQLNMKSGDVQREIAALRHMEKVKAAMQEGVKVFVAW